MASGQTHRCSLETILSKWIYFGEITSAVLIFASLLNSDQLFEERICSSGRKFIHLSVDLFYEEFRLQESEHEAIKVVSLCKNGGYKFRYSLGIVLK